MMRRFVPFVLAATLLAAAPARATELRAHGLLDLVLASGDAALDGNRFTQGDSNFDPYRLHLFVDAKVSPTIDVYLESILHEGGTPIGADGAYAQWTPWAERDAHLEAGKIPWPIGTWAARAYSDQNPLVGTPLMEQYHTSLAWNVPVASVDALVAAAGKGPSGVGYASGVTGMPVLDDRWWDVGAVVLGSQRPFEYALGVTQGSPGWPVGGEDVTPGQTVLGRFGLAPVAGLRAGVSGSWGTWMPEWFAASLPDGGSTRDYHEGLGMADLELSRGPWELHSEGFLKTWDTQNAGTLHVRGGYAEARLGIGAGAWLAARYGVMRFGDVTTSAGVTRPWDDGVDRLEAGVGYRVSHDVRVKAAFQRDVTHPWAADAQASDLVALTASIRL